MWRKAIVISFLASALMLDSAATRAQNRRLAFDVAEASIAELQQAMTSGRTTSKAIVQQYLDRIEAFDKRGPKLNAVIAVNPAALKDAEALDRERATKGPRGPLHGVPIVVKDNYDVAGMATTGASVGLVNNVVKEDAFQIRKLREAGAIILAKTNMQEFAAGYLTESSLGGQTRNPYDPTRVPGGSSGGTGAAVAASFAAAGMGTDTCGSIREPSSVNNLVGLRPTKGLFSTAGVLPYSETQDTAGPLARSVTDLAAILDATFAETLSPTSDPKPPILKFTASLNERALAGIRIGIVRTPATGNDGNVASPYGFGHTSEDQPVTDVVNAAIAEMKTLGASTVDVKFDTELVDQLATASVIGFEFKEDLDQYLSSRPGGPGHSLEEIAEQGWYMAAFGGRLKAFATNSRKAPAYAQAMARRSEFRRRLLQLMESNNVDVLLYPTVTRKPAKIGEQQQGAGNCGFAAISGSPAISFPAGFTADRLPVGVELLGRPYDDAKLLSFAYAYEQATHHRQPPDLTPPLHGQRLSAPLTWRAAENGISGTFGFDLETNELHYKITVTGKPAVALATLRQGPTGTAGPVLKLLARNSAAELTGTEILSSASRAALLDGQLYVSISTNAQETSALRLQLIPPKP